MKQTNKKKMQTYYKKRLYLAVKKKIFIKEQTKNRILTNFPE